MLFPTCLIGIQVRLKGSIQCTGTVEIYYNGTWGTVCDDDWDLNDAMVVCRQLGCDTALSGPQSAFFDQGTGPIWLDNVACSGREMSLADCKHNGFGIHNCEHSEDAGVVCSGEKTFALSILDKCMLPGHSSVILTELCPDIRYPMSVPYSKHPRYQHNLDEVILIKDL